MLDAEGGTRFLNLQTVAWDPMTQKPPEPDGTWNAAVVTVRDYSVITKVWQWLNSGQHPFDSLIVDSISEVQQKLIEKVAGREQPKTQHWGDVLRQFVGTLRDFRDLAEHPVKPLQAIILVSMTKQGSDGVYHPWMQGQSATFAPYLFDITGAMVVETFFDESGGRYKVHRLYVDQNTEYEVGERVGGRLPAWLDNPNVETILDYVFGPKDPQAAAPAAPEQETSSPD